MYFWSHTNQSIFRFTLSLSKNSFFKNEFRFAVFQNLSSAKQNNSVVLFAKHKTASSHYFQFHHAAFRSGQRRKTLLFFKSESPDQGRIRGVTAIANGVFHNCFGASLAEEVVFVVVDAVHPLGLAAPIRFHWPFHLSHDDAPVWEDFRKYKWKSFTTSPVVNVCVVDENQPLTKRILFVEEIPQVKMHRLWHALFVEKFTDIQLKLSLPFYCRDFNQLGVQSLFQFQLALLRQLQNDSVIIVVAFYCNAHLQSIWNWNFEFEFAFSI